jgi:diketogulonate reductase-like aldo/keto reductase
MHNVSANGATIPVIGFGTWPMRGRQCAEAVAHALNVGYRHIDTAQGYGNETDVADGIAHAGIKRADIFITTKVRPEALREGELQASVEESLRKLRVDQVDLTLIHWPNPDVPVKEAIQALCEVKKRGLTKNIGVSNFTIKLLDEAVARASEPLATEQLEYHPFLDQTKVLAAIRRHGMATTAYCPIALGRVVGDPVIERIGKAHGKTAAQVTLRWLIQQGDVIAIPKSSHAARIEENLAVFDFSLDAAEMAEMDTLRAKNLRLVNQRSLVPAWD